MGNLPSIYIDLRGVGTSVLLFQSPCVKRKTRSQTFQIIQLREEINDVM